MKEIQLNHGMVALVDDEDFATISQSKWNAQKHEGTFYARSTRRLGKSRTGKSYQVYMHVLLLGLRVGLIVDHRNRNGLDNQRSNLRWATHGQNNANKRTHKGSSRFKGVTWFSRDGLWRAQIQANNKNRHIGYFESEEAAARAYDLAALRHFGEFSLLNFPDAFAETTP